MARLEYLPAPLSEIRLDLAILRADRNIAKHELALNKVICSLHPHKVIVETMKAHSQRVGSMWARVMGIRLFRARNEANSVYSQGS
jgi:hypothetical protein